MALGQKTGGRTKGTPNKVTTETAAKVAASGLTPLEYMLDLLRQPDADEADRKWAAQNAAPYVHPKLSSVEANVTAKISAYDWLLGEG